MAYQPVDIGAVANDGTGDPLRDAFDKINDNFVEVYAGLVGLFDPKGTTDCSANPNYPVALKGDVYLVSVAGKIGGASGKVVEVGDVFIAFADNAGGTEASVGASWSVLQNNLTYVPVNKAGDTMTGDLIVPAEAYGVGWNGSNEAPTKNDVYDKIEAVVSGGGYTDEQVRDVIAAALVAGTNITITPNDGADTITIDASGGSYTSENARDDIAAALVAGTNITITPNDGADTITIAATGGSGNDWNLQWGPLVGEAPTSNYATLDSRNLHPVLDFDATTQETIYFHGVLPADYAGAGLTVSIWCAATSATTGTIGWDVSIERIDVSSLDIDADSFATAQTVTATTVPGTSGQVLKLSVNISSGANMDSLAAGELFRLRIRRDVANDTATGDAELLRVMMVEQ